MVNRNSTITERAATLTAKAVRLAARKYFEAGCVPPPGFGQSRHHNVWIALDDGKPEAYPPKVILTWAAGDMLRNKEGYAHDGPWTTQLRKLGFPVLSKNPKVILPTRGQDCRGKDLSAHRGKAEGTARSSAKPLPHVKAYRALTATHVRAATRSVSPQASALSPDPYAIWIDGKAYPFWPLFRASVAAAGGPVRHNRRLLRGHQPEHDRVRALGFDVLPRGISAVPPATAGHGTPALPPVTAVTVPALRQATALLGKAPEFRDRREGAKYALWVDGRGPYPIKAACLLAFHSLGLGWHEAWKMGGAQRSPMAKHLCGLPGIQILAKGECPDADGGRARTLAEDLKAIEQSDVETTTREQLVDARLGQGRYRRQLEEHWGAACAVTGVSQREALRASHIVPWKGSDNTTRLDPHNGLLLVATLDCLFDRWPISFARDGKLLVGPISPDDQRKLGLDPKAMRLRTDGKLHLTAKRLAFLHRHRRKFLALHGRKDEFANA